jgi:hypothetical protein
MTTNQQSFETTVMLYPNPANSYFSINKNVASIEIYTITGQLVKSYQDVTADSSINIEEMSKGIYMVKCIDENQASKTFKLIKR